jgi:hypothetical protein
MNFISYVETGIRWPESRGGIIRKEERDQRKGENRTMGKKGGWTGSMHYKNITVNPPIYTINMYR